MNFEFSEEQQMLRDQARSYLTQHCPTTLVRRVLNNRETHDADLYKGIAEMGWTATTIPCLLYTSPSPRDATLSRMPSSA